MTKWDNYCMKVAEQTAKLSYCKKKQVGAVIAKEGRIISTGYNGTPSGFITNCCEDSEDKTKHDLVIHAEMNALAFVLKEGGFPVKGATIYVTLSPCADCAKLIGQSGITKLIYKEKYKDTKGLQFLRKTAVEVEQYKGE